MEVRDIIELLRAGWKLANRRAGWYLSAPKNPITKTNSILSATNW